MNTAHYILATAGHVDHGKSALVKALTGTDPDRLPEERARGITIDLGFAHLTLGSRSQIADRNSVPPADAGAHVPPANADLRSPTFDLGIVDVPGHEDFVKNMVAGVGSIDLALLVVAADDGWMPQTEEHLQILTYLGVTRGVIALTKIDLATDVAAALASVRDDLRGSPLAHAPIVPTSIVSGCGLDELKSALAVELLATPPPADIGKPRLAIDRVFVLRGIGTVVTGTLAGGSLRRGQIVAIQPREVTTRIRTLQCHNREVDLAPAGTRTALNLPDLAANTGIARGEVITLPELGRASLTLDVLLEKSPRLAGAQLSAARPLKDGTLTRVHLGSTNVSARVALAGPDPLQPGQQQLAQLRLESPLFAFAGDRFIVRDASEQATLAGGLILDPDAARRGFHRPTRLEFLSPRARHPHDAAAFVKTLLQRDGFVPRLGLLTKSRFAEVHVREIVQQLLRQSCAAAAGMCLADVSVWNQLRQQAALTIVQHHRTCPEQPGLPLSQLKAALAKTIKLPEALEGIVEALLQSGFTQTGTAIRRSDFQPTLPSHLQAAGQRLRQILADKALDVPSRKELAPDARAQQALRFLIQTGEAVELGPDVVISADTHQKARDTILCVLKARGRATTSDLRQALGSSRRITIPLLETLDTQGLTRREGDFRVLRS